MSHILSYTVENIKMIFNQLKSTDETRSCYWFTVKIDGVEIIPFTDELKHFNDFMLYDLSVCDEIEFLLYHAPDRLAHGYKFFLQQKDEWEIYLKNENSRLEKENEMFQSQIKTLKQTIRKQDRKRQYEKPEGIKIIDADEMFVLFVSKRLVDKALSEELVKAQKTAVLNEKILRVFHRFVYQPKK